MYESPEDQCINIKLNVSNLKSWILFASQIAEFICNCSRKPSFSMILQVIEELFSPAKCPNYVTKDKNKHFKVLHIIVMYICYTVSFFMFKEDTI